MATPTTTVATAAKNGREYYVVNAFTAEKYSGNPAAVVFLQGLDTFPVAETMQIIAREFNLSETAFIVRHSSFPLQYKIRWFKPTREVPLCGHATLASAHVLYSHYNHPADQPIYFETTTRGLLTCSSDTPRQGLRIINMQLPLDMPQPVHSDSKDEYAATAAVVAAALRLPRDGENGKPAPVIKYIGKVATYMLVEIDGIDITTLKPDFPLLEETVEESLIVTCRPSTANCPAHLLNYDFVSRMFAPRGGFDEDPVTGSAHSVLAPYYRAAAGDGKTKFAGYQASQRGGVVLCEVKEKDKVVVLRGSAVSVMRGNIL